MMVLLLLLLLWLLLIDGTRMRRVSRSSLQLLGGGGEVQWLLRLLHPRALAWLQAVRVLTPLLREVLVRSFRQLVGGFEQRHVGRCPNSRGWIRPDTDAVRRGRGR